MSCIKDCSDQEMSPLSDDEQGSQGYVCKCMWEDSPAVAKSSNHVDFVLDLEETAAKTLEKLDCVHFCSVLGRKTFSNSSDILIFEEIIHSSEDKNDTLANLIYLEEHHPTAILNCVRQTLAAIVMFETLGITHYDLHADNVMITDATHDIHVYDFGQGRVVPIQTNGIVPVIIDFGMSHVPQSKFGATCAFVHQGFTPFASDPLVDSRLLLKTVSKDLRRMVKSFRSRTKSVFNSKYKESCLVIEQFAKKIDLMFKSLKLEQHSGWFPEHTFEDVPKDLTARIPFQTKKGIFKKENFPWVLELVQHELTVPVTERVEDAPSFEHAVARLALLWKKFVEPVIRNTHEEQIFLKDLVNTTTNSGYVRLRHRYPKIKNMVRLKKCVKDLANSFGNYVLEASVRISEKKRDLYSKVPFQNTLAILNALPKMPISYAQGMTVLVMNRGGGNSEFELTTDMADSLNSCECDSLAMKRIVERLRKANSS
jgi:serine/threonine protein kinase